MTNDITPKRVSLSRKAWDEAFASKKDMAPWILAAILLNGTMQFLMPASADPAFIKQHPELALKDLLHILSLTALSILPAFFLSYAMVITYLRYAAKSNSPQMSVRGFFYWLGRVLAKLFRPALWIFLPVIGLVFYVRALLRRMPLSPMAALGQPDTLQRSWDLTEGNVWRILGQSLWLNLKIAILLFFVLIGPSIVLIILLHARPGDLIDRIVRSFYHGVLAGFLTTANAVYCCTVYRVLSQERKAAAVSITPASV